MDDGNIWLMGYDSSRPGGQFKWNSAINEIAIGGGLGLRLNFEYFIYSPFKNWLEILANDAVAPNKVLFL